MLPNDPEREAIGRTIAAVLMAKQIRRSGQHSSGDHPDRDRRARGLRGADVDPQVRDRAAEARPDNVLVEVVTKNGEKFYFSDLLNWILFENVTQPPYSIWAYVMAAVPDAEPSAVAGPLEIVSNAARTIGTRRYGVPRLPAGHVPLMQPRAALDAHWREVARGARCVSARSRGMALRSRLGGAVADAHKPRHARAAARSPIVMEAAIPMSKVDPFGAPVCSRSFLGRLGLRPHDHCDEAALQLLGGGGACKDEQLLGRLDPARPPGALMQKRFRAASSESFSSIGTTWYTPSASLCATA